MKVPMKLLLAASGGFMAGWFFCWWNEYQKSLRDRFELIFDFGADLPADPVLFTDTLGKIGERLRDICECADLMLALQAYARAAKAEQELPVLSVDLSQVLRLHMLMHKLMYSGFNIAQRLGVLAKLDA